MSDFVLSGAALKRIAWPSARANRLDATRRGGGARALAFVALGLLTACVAESEPPDLTTNSIPVTVPEGPLDSLPPGEAPVTLAEVAFELDDVVDGLADPVVLQARSGTPNLYVAERAGRIRVVERTLKVDARTGISSITTERLSSRAVLDITENVKSDQPEQGLLGMAFSSDGSRLYVAYTDAASAVVVAEHNMRPLEDRAGTSRRELLRVEQLTANHNGGSLVFGADGFLYVGLGDGGGQDDPFGVAQDTESLLGSILRLDPDVLRTGENPPPFEVPSGNPFLEGGGLPEVWLYGVQDPWRFSFDSRTGDLWVADTGGTRREEITRLQAINGTGRGANLGWGFFEGSEQFGTDDPPADARMPIHEYDHTAGCRVVGGVVFRGSVEGFDGTYVFGDRCTGRITGLQAPPEEPVTVRDLEISVGENLLSSFGADNDGQVYVLSTDGALRRIVATAPERPDAIDEGEGEGEGEGEPES